MTQVTLTICGDHSRLSIPGHQADGCDLYRYQRRLRQLLVGEFGTEITIRLGPGLSVECEDTALGERVHARVADIQATPEWVELAHGYAE